jgi:rare lipoprotein A
MQDLTAANSPSLRQRPRSWLTACLLGAMVLGLGGCAETAFLTNTAKQIRSLGEEPKSIGRYKVGTPYQIKGVWYYPRVDYGYDESGIASWYGPNFHNKATANGEVFDQNAVSAAHRSLPLPTVVRVTNLENGRALVVRINDRGPFAHGRIIDMSRRAAQLLDFERRGTARVRVQVLPRESREAVKLAQAGGVPAPVVSNANAPDAVPVSSVSVATLTPVPGTTLAPPPEAAVEKVTPAAKSAIELTRQSRQSALQDQPVERTNLFVQAASFSKQSNASRLKSQISDIGSASVYRVQIDGKQFYRVRIGPLNDVGMADRVLIQVIARGFPGARITVD